MQNPPHFCMCFLTEKVLSSQTGNTLALWQDMSQAQVSRQGSLSGLAVQASWSTTFQRPVDDARAGSMHSGALGSRAGPEAADASFRWDCIRMDMLPFPFGQGEPGFWAEKPSVVFFLPPRANTPHPCSSLTTVSPANWGGGDTY